ncbi:MAG: PQQ-binding-like beta-propeller repeat protein, partial [Chloroflexi bacterium]|nr:PQQ-binding-like beta-propeller repeat protein [Chloroflexota bacterium]
TGALKWQLDLEVRIEAATISSDGKLAYTGSRDSRLACYDIATQAKLWEVQLDRIVYTIAAPADGSIVYTGGDGKKAIAVEAATGAILWTFPVGDRIASITATEDSSVIAVAAWDGKVYLLDKTGALLQTIAGGSEVHTVSVSADGEVVVAGTAAGRVFAVNLSSAKSAQRAKTTRTAIWTALGIAALALALALFYRYITRVPAGIAWWTPHARSLRRTRRAMWKGRLGYLFILPTFILLIIFNYYPSVMGLGLGFTEWSPGQPRPPQFVGLYNYKLVLQNPNTLAAMRNVSIFALADLAKTLIGPLIIAELIFALSKSKQQYTWRTVFIIPLIVPSVASILMWSNILDPNLGLINNVLFKLGLASPLSPPTWLGNPATALPALIFVGFPWIGAFPLLIYYGGLISISSDILDAAKVDGASGLRRVFSIDIPILLPQIRLLSVLSVIGSLQQFGLVLLTTRGGPGNATTTPVYEMYMQGINSGRYGYAAALASMLFVIILAITLVNMRVMRDRPGMR